jgi:transposase InsO family protein
MSQSLDQELSLNALRMALVDHVPQIHHSNQGVHYAAHAYIDLLREYQIEISMAVIGSRVGHPLSNADFLSKFLGPLQ